MELSLRDASKLLPAVVAFHGLRDLAVLESGRFDAGVCFGVRDFLQGFILVVLEPLESALHCRRVRIKDNMKLEGSGIQPPLFLTAISARAFSKPISKSCSKSVSVIAAIKNVEGFSQVKLRRYFG